MKLTLDFYLHRSGLRGLSIIGTFVALVSCSGEGEIEQPIPLLDEMTIDYPLSLWDQAIEGETLLRVRVTEIGSIDSVEISESSGYRAFDSAAVVGVAGLQFSPAIQDGKKIGVWVTLPVLFSKRPQRDSNH